MKKLLIVCTVLGLAAAGSAWAQQCGGPEGRNQRGGGMKGFGHGPAGIQWLVHNEDAAKKFGVTDDQLSQLRELTYQSELAQIKGRADLEIAQMELRRLLDGAKPTEEAVGKAVDKISALEAQLQKARISEMLKAREIVGQETMDKIRDAMKERMRERGMDRNRDRRGDRQGRGPGSDDDAPQAGPPEDD